MVKLDQNVDHQASNLGKSAPIEQLQKRQAELSDFLDKLNLDLLQIKGKLEESTHFYSTLKDENAELQSKTNEKVLALSDQIVLLADQINQTSDSLNVIKQENTAALNQARMAEERAIAAEEAAVVAAAEAQRKLEEERTAFEAKQKKGPREIAPQHTKLKPGEKPKEKTSSESSQGPGKDIYDRALSLFRESKFNDAYRAFSEYIDQYPSGKMAPNARFWQGDCYYNQQEFELAILEYQKVIADYPSHAKAPAALLKQGLAFEKLKDNETAKIVYQKLLEEYPKSEQVPTVKKRLESLK